MVFIVPIADEDTQGNYDQATKEKEFIRLLVSYEATVLADDH